MKTTLRLVAVALGLGVAAGLFVLGRVTAHDGSTRQGRDAGYARGLADGRAQGERDGRAQGERDGRAQGERDGRADVEVRSLPAGTRDAAKAAFDDGYRAGANEVFTGYDGGWSYDVPYIVTLARGGTGVTYRLASRTPLHPGVDYHLCPNAVTLCQEPHR
jgi:hypothetical protein